VTHVLTCRHTHMHIHIHIHTHTYIQAHTHSCTHARIFTYTHTHTHTHTRALILDTCRSPQRTRKPPFGSLSAASASSSLQTVSSLRWLLRENDGLSLYVFMHVSACVM